MSLFLEMQAANIVKNFKAYSCGIYGKDNMMIDINYMDDIITLVSDYPLSKTPEGFRKALEHTHLYSFNRGKIMSFNKGRIKSINSPGKTYYAKNNILYTPEGLYLCSKSWAKDEFLRRKASAITEISRKLGMIDAVRNSLRELGPLLLVKF